MGTHTIRTYLCLLPVKLYYIIMEVGNRLHPVKLKLRILSSARLYSLFLLIAFSLYY